MILCGHFTRVLLLWLCVASTLGSGSKPNVFCIMEYCGSQSVACMENHDCRENMACITGCGLSNTTCINICINTYENKQYDDMMRCMVYDHHCLTLEPPDPSFRCSPPATFKKNFSLSQLAGTWHVVRGLNRDYDCFDCHVSHYSPSATSKNYTADERFDVAMVNGSVRHRLVVQQVEQKTPSNGGLLDYTNHMMAMTMYEKWHVVYYPDGGHFVVFYYCGHVNSNWWYEGSLVYSRSPVLAPGDLATVEGVVRSTMGHTLDQYCAPNTRNCQTDLGV